MTAPGAELSMGRAESVSFLDARACLELLGSLYPLSASMLFFRLEAFLREADSLGQPGEVSIPRRLLLANLNPERITASGRGMALEKLPTEVVVEFDPSSQGCTLRFAPADRGYDPVRERECEGARLRIHIREESGLSKWVSMPLQFLMVAWGDVSAGFQCFTYTVEFLGEDGELIECWTHVGVSTGDWMSCMDEFEREVRSGGNRLFSAAWQKYVGAACVVLHSRLLRVGQAEEAAREWEKTEISRLTGAGRGPAVAPGGLAGMRVLYEEGDLTAAGVTMREREGALTNWVAHLQAPAPPPGLPRMLALAWHGNRYVKPDPERGGETLTPADIVHLRRLFRAGESVESIAASIGATDLAAVQAAVAAIGNRH